MAYPKFVVVDLETTGNKAKKGDRMIQASFVVIENYQITEQYTTFLNPGIPIPAFIEELTGIHDEMVETAPYFEEVAPKLLTMLDGAFFVAHNVSFDLNFLQAELEEAGYNPFDGYTIDTVEMARIMFPTFDSYKLIDLTEKFGINHNRPHQADSDAYVTAELFLMMVEKLTSLPLVTLETLVELSKSLKSDLSILLEKIVSRKQQKIDRLPDEVEVFRGVALRKRETVKQERKKLIGEFPETMDQKESLLRKLPSYERRESQLKMMDYVYHSLIQNEHAVIEAGTGVGKSLGYLMPAVYYSKEVGEPIVISTYTIVLQQQLLHKEIRQLEKIVPFPVRAVVLKGKNHYIDLFKFVNSLKDSSDNYDFALAKMQILMWLLETETGDVDEINLSSGGWHFWNQVKQDGDYLNKERKSWLGRDFYLHAKKQAKEADVVITNHSLLVTDLKAESDVLPPYKHVIIDEAHHFEKAARDKLGKSLDSLSFKLLIGQLGTLHQKQLFFQCEEILQKYGETPNIQSIEIDREIASLMFEADEWFHTLQIYFEYHTKQKGGSSSRKQLRITELERGWKYWQEASLGAERLVADMNSMSGRLLKRLHLLEKHKEQMNVKEQVVLSDLYSFLADWREWIEQIEEVMFYTSEEHVVWMEGDIRSVSNSLMIRSQPIQSAEMIKRLLLNEKNAIFTSATLTVNQSFEFFTEEIGLKDFHPHQYILPSPFNYKENCRILIPRDIPDIKKVKMDEYIEAVASHLIGVAQATKGRMLVLFTSYDMLRRTYDLMKDSGLLDDFVLMAQGISSGSQTRLTKNFQKFEKAILFGTNSFWEGVDIPGEDLSCLAIVRLPFSPPDEPYVQAKSEAVVQRGKNPFSAYSLPQAILRFKQGFGRLIRSEKDRGIIIIFDRRIETTTYGKAFIKSVPSVPVQQAELDELIHFIEDWL